jgi:hypothetical protein
MDTADDGRTRSTTGTTPDTADDGTAEPATGTPAAAGGTAPAPSGVSGDVPLGEHAPALLAAEHWSLLAARSMIWNEAQSRATVFLTVLSASIIALALLADATGFGEETTTLALVLLPLVFLLGLAAYARLVQINVEEFELVLAMNRLRRAYLTLEPGLERYLSTGHHDDEAGVFATYLVSHPRHRALWLHFLVNTPNIVATVDAALAAAMAVLGLRAAGAPDAVLVPAGLAVFLLVWVTLFLLQRQTLAPFRDRTPRFPTPTPHP